MYQTTGRENVTSRQMRKHLVFTDLYFDRTSYL